VPFSHPGLRTRVPYGRRRELGTGPVEVALDGTDRHDQPLGDLPVGQSPSGQGDDLGLPLGEWQRQASVANAGVRAPSQACASRCARLPAAWAEPRSPWRACAATDCAAASAASSSAPIASSCTDAACSAAPSSAASAAACAAVAARGARRPFRPAPRAGRRACGPRNRPQCATRPPPRPAGVATRPPVPLGGTARRPHGGCRAHRAGPPAV
jgi:hypothetical protein